MSVWSALLQHEGILGALAGTIVGSVGTVMLTWWQGRQTRRVAKMQVATRLRNWGNLVYDRVCDAMTFSNSEGHGGQYQSTLPTMPLESELAHVAALEPRLAERIFNLIHQKDDANANVRGSLEYVDEDEALDEFRNGGARLYLEAADLYKELAGSLGWSVDAFPQSARETMLAECRRYESLKAIRQPGE